MAHDEPAALDAAAGVLPDVMLLDIGMPKLNGYEVARHIRQQPWGDRVTLIADTGWGQDDDKREARNAGFDYHLTKPIDFIALRKILNSDNVGSAGPAS